MASLPTTSFDYWWPYPPWGATTSPSEGSSPTSIPTTNSPVDTLLPSLVTISASDVSTARPVATTSASSTTSASVIRITALPPSNNTSSQKSTVYSRHGFDVAYLAPLFAVLAAVAGALCTWFFLRRYSRRRERKARGSSILQPGPRYIAPEHHEHNASQSGSEGSSSRSGEGSSLLQGRTDSQKGGWVARALSRSLGSSRLSRGMPASSPSTAAGRQRSLRGPNTPLNNPYSAVEDNLSLDNSATGLLDDGLPQRSGTRSTARITSPDLLSPGYGDDPGDPLRHKSIRRAIIERLKWGTLRRPEKDRDVGSSDIESGRMQGSPARRVSFRRAHRRNDSDFNVEDIQEREAFSATPSRANSSAQQAMDRSLLLSPPGFRIIEEDSEADAERARFVGSGNGGGMSESGTPARENPAWEWIASWSPTPSIRTTHDSYTTLPVRRTTLEKRSTPAASLSHTDKFPLTAPRMPRVDSSILPSSPPQLMSPPLHSQLFFSDFESTPSLDLHASRGKDNAPALAASESVSRVNKLHTKRQPDPMPFPSNSSSSPYRGKLKKPRPGDLSAASPPMYTRGVALFDPPLNPGFTADVGAGGHAYAQTLLARQSALDKVGEIVSRGLSQRDLANSRAAENHSAPLESYPDVTQDRVVRLQTRDGVPVAALGDGIAQRLELLRVEEQAAMEGR